MTLLQQNPLLILAGIADRGWHLLCVNTTVYCLYSSVTLITHYILQPLFAVRVLKHRKAVD